MIESVASRYRELVVLRAAERRVRIKNMLSQQVSEEYRSLNSSPEGRAAVASLIDDPHVEVRLMAAADSLEWWPEKAVPMLEEIERGSGLVSVSAKYALIGYRSGAHRRSDLPPQLSSRRVSVRGEALDRALSVHGLVMDGGLRHAWDIDSEGFVAAYAGFTAVERRDVADIYKQARLLFEREDVSGPHSPEGEDRETELTIAYYRLPNPQDSIEGVLASNDGASLVGDDDDEY